MVLRLNNDIMRHYTPIECKNAEQPNAIQPDSKAPDLSPILERAQYHLGKRLQVLGDSFYVLDGKAALLRDVIAAVNAHIRTVGGQYIAYPGLKPRYEKDAASMRIQQRLPDDAGQI